MDTASINQFYNEHYIPVAAKPAPKRIPSKVPSLIMQDTRTDTTHHLACGCCPDACIHEHAWWSSKPEPVRPSLAPYRSTSSVSSLY